MLQILITSVFQELRNDNWIRRSWWSVLHNSQRISESLYKEIIEQLDLGQWLPEIESKSIENTGLIERLLWSQLDWKL